MTVIEKKEPIKTIENTRTKYVTSDGKEFLNKGEAEVHDGYLKWTAEIKRRNIKRVENAYFCKTKEDLEAVVMMLAYRAGAFNWKERKYTLFNHYENYQFSGEDWYFFEHEEFMDYPDSYTIETLTQKKKEFADWVKSFEDMVD